MGRGRENEEKLTGICAVGCNWLCLTVVKCQIFFIIPLSCLAVINGIAPGGHESHFYQKLWCTRVHQNFEKEVKMSIFSTLFTPLTFLQMLCHAHEGSGVHDMHCYTPNKTNWCGGSACQRAS